MAVLNTKVVTCSPIHDARARRQRGRRKFARLQRQGYFRRYRNASTSTENAGEGCRRLG